MTGDTPIRVDAPGAIILIQPRRDGEPDRQTEAEKHDQEHHKIVLTSPKAMDVVITQRYVCQIKAQRHINICAPEIGYLNEIIVNEGQAVKKGDLMFKLEPVLYKTRRDAESAEARLAELEWQNTKRLYDNKKLVSEREVMLFEARKNKAKAKADQAPAELDFTEIRAAFDGIIDRLNDQSDGLVKEGDILTTLSDNSVMWVYFNVPEARYLEYMANRKEYEDAKIELELANHNQFPQSGKIAMIESEFNYQTGNIAFRRIFRTRTDCCATGRPAPC